VRINLRADSPPRMVFTNSHESYYKVSGEADSGTCSDLDGSSPTPLPKKKSGAQRGIEGSDDEISCDSLNSSECESYEPKYEPEVPKPDYDGSTSPFLEKYDSVGDTDSFFNFHLNEHKLDDVKDPCEGSEEDTFAGGRQFTHAGTKFTIRSSKGTIRGVKNRVKESVQLFLQQPNVKSWQDKEAGKVVVYTSTMGIVRRTHQRCQNVRHILRTHLVKFVERDTFMSREVQEEIKERMGQKHVELPQVFIEGVHIGGAETIEKLNESGELRQMLKPFRSIEATKACTVCGGFGFLPCGMCNGSKKSVHRNHLKAEWVPLKCMNCDEVGLVKCEAC